jgi:hypothetical protein
MTSSEFLGIQTEKNLEYFRQRLILRNERLKEESKDKAKSWLRKSVFETKEIIKKYEHDNN